MNVSQVILFRMALIYYNPELDSTVNTEAN